MQPLHGTELQVRLMLIDTILAARADGETDERIAAAILDAHDANTLNVGLGLDAYAEETWNASFWRQYHDIFRPEGIRLC